MIALHAKKIAIAAMLYCMSIRCILNAAIPKKKPAKGNDKIFVTDALSQCDSRCSFMTNLVLECKLQCLGAASLATVGLHGAKY